MEDLDKTEPGSLRKRDADATFTSATFKSAKSSGQDSSGQDREDSHCSLDSFEYIDLIGEGGMGVVHKYRNTADDTLVAVKMLTSHRYAAETLQRFSSKKGARHAV